MCCGAGSHMSAALGPGKRHLWHCQPTACAAPCFPPCADAGLSSCTCAALQASVIMTVLTYLLGGGNSFSSGGPGKGMHRCAGVPAWTPSAEEQYPCAHPRVNAASSSLLAASCWRGVTAGSWCVPVSFDAACAAATTPNAHPVLCCAACPAAACTRACSTTTTGCTPAPASPTRSTTRA